MLSGLIYRAPICDLLISPPPPLRHPVFFFFFLFNANPIGVASAVYSLCRCVTSRSLLSRRRIKMRRARTDDAGYLSFVSSLSPEHT